MFIRFNAAGARDAVQQAVAGQAEDAKAAGADSGDDPTAQNAVIDALAGYISASVGARDEQATVSVNASFSCEIG